MIDFSRFSSISTLAILTLTSLNAYAEEYDWVDVRTSARRQIERQEDIKADVFIDQLGVTSDMNVLDIGAGAGYVSFLFADKIKGGTGKVYATDILADRIEWMEAEAKKRGLSNLVFARVQPVGFDSFYERQSYDLAYVSNVYHAIEDPIDYFSALRRTLRPHARLVVVIYDQEPIFTQEDIVDPDGLIAALLAESEDSPFLKSLSMRTKSLLKERQENTDSFAIAVADDFNQILRDLKFFNGFIKKSQFRNDFKPETRDFADWLIMDLKDEGAFGRSLDELDPRSRRKLARLNRLFISAQFGAYLAKEGRGHYVPRGDVNRYTSKFAAIRELGLAGFKLSKEHKLSPHFDGLIFVPSSPNGAR